MSTPDRIQLDNSDRKTRLRAMQNTYRIETTADETDAEVYEIPAANAGPAVLQAIEIRRARVGSDALVVARVLSGTDTEGWPTS